MAEAPRGNPRSSARSRAREGAGGAGSAPRAGAAQAGAAAPTQAFQGTLGDRKTKEFGVTERFHGKSMSIFFFFPSYLAVV